MTKENDNSSLKRSGPSPNRGRGRGYGYSHSHGHGSGHDSKGHGSGHGRSHGHGRGQGHVPGGKGFGGHGQGRGRASDAIYRSEQFSGSSAASRLGGDSAPSSAESVGSITSWPNKQPPLSGLHELLVGLRGGGRGNIRTNKDTDLHQPAIGSTNRRGGRLSWAEMRRQSQRSNSTADDSSEPDGSIRSSQNVYSFVGGGWGGRGRGRLLDPSSVKRPGNDEDTSAWSGRGRGGILFVPGVNFHSVPNSTGWKHYGTNDPRILNSRHSVEGRATNVQSSQSFTRKETVSAHSGKNKYQRRNKKTRKDKECNSGDKANNCVNEVVTDISSAEDDKNLLYQRKHSIVSNIEENLQKQLIIKTDDSIHVDMQKAVVTVNCSAQQKTDGKEFCKPEHLCPRGGRTRGIVPFEGSVFTIGDNLDTQNTSACERVIEKKPSDP